MGSTENNTTLNVTDLSSESDPDYKAASVSISTEWADAIENSEHAECHSHDNHDNFENSDLDATLTEQETWSTVVQQDRNRYAPPQASDFVVPPNTSNNGQLGLVTA